METASTWGSWTARSNEVREQASDEDVIDLRSVQHDTRPPSIRGREHGRSGSGVGTVDQESNGLHVGRSVDVAVTPYDDLVHADSDDAALEAVVTRPPLELHEIHDYVQRELAGLDVRVHGNHNRFYRAFKRVIDLAVAVPALIVAAPIIGLMALAIRLESKGPAVFRQQRVGADGRVFTFYKFRTMYVDAKERFPELYDYDFETSELSSRYYKHANDPRNTRLGALIRQTTLDELPNLFNVVKGDTSLVGPRPELPEMIRHYHPSQLVKFDVKPGLTGLAACTGRNTLTIDEQIRADVEYVAGQSVKLDTWIVVETAKMIIKSVGAE